MATEKTNKIKALEQRIKELEDRVSKYKDIYARLVQSEEQYRLLVESLPMGIVLHDGQEILYANPWAMKLVGATRPNQIVGKQLKDFVHPDTWELAAPRIRKLMYDRQGVGLFHEKFLKVNGTAFDVYVAAIPVFYKDRDAVLVSIHDISEEIRIKQELQKQRDLAQRYLDIAEVIMMALDKQGRITMINRKGCELLGYSQEELIGMNWFDHFTPEEFRSQKKQRLSTLMKGEDSLLPYHESQVITRFGVRTIAWYNTLMYSDDGQITGTLSSGQDITVQKQAQEELLKQKERLAVTLASIGDGVIATDAQGNVTLLNGVAQRMTGWTQEEALGRPLAEVFRIVNERTGEAMENPVEKVITKGVIVGLANGTMLIARDGRKFIIADSGAPIKDSKGGIVGVVMVFRDVTQQKQWQEERQRLQRFETLELMAGGIAHDFNNLLTGVLGNLSLLTQVISEDFPGKTHLWDAQKSVLAARKLVGQLSLLSKGGAPVKQNASIIEVVRTSSEIAVTGSNARLAFDVDADLWSVMCDVDQISQVIQNVVLNSVQAMPAGGVIRVQAKNEVIKSKTDLPIPEGRYVRIRISDQGIGIPKQYLDRVFDPYFTTKQNGSGLGLAIVYSVVTKHGGFVDIQSGYGKGTTITVWLPAAQQTESDGRKEDKTDGISGGRILVVDDESMVRDVCTKMLAYMGYDVQAADNSSSAIELVKEARSQNNPFDMAILDLTMPGDISGVELCSRILQEAPDLTVIASSGYIDDPVMEDPQNFGFTGILKKPYTLQELRASLVMAAQRKDRRQE